MIVSPAVDISPMLGTYRKIRTFKAVGRSVPDSSIVSAQPPEVPHFARSKSIAKPFIYDEHDPKCTMGYVPLKSLQLNSRVEGVSLFNAPIGLVAAPLNGVIPMRKEIDYDALMADVEMPFQPVFEYNKGIRPAARVLKGEAVAEPDAPFPTRTGRPASDKEIFGTYKLGKQEINLIGY